MFKYEYHPEEITEALFSLVREEGEETKENFEKTKDCIYDLLCCAENKYNRDSFRALYRLLERITEAVETHSIR